MSRKLFFCLVLLFSSNVLEAQVFVDVTESQGIAALNGSTMYGTGSSCFDVNEDGWDDLTICIAGGATRLYMNNQGVFQLLTAFENVHDAKTCLWGDYDEDGDNDLFVIKRDGPTQLFVQTDSLVFVNQTGLLNYTFSASYNSFGAALGDYNRDSFLDLYIANYGLTSAGSKSIWLTNNQNGTYTCNTHGYLRNHFQPTFIDLFRDLHQDIFVINDFADGNELYTQNAMGVFTDQTPSGSFGLIGIPNLDAMSNSWCDYDNDADFDNYITNTPEHGNFLYQNNGSNVFTNVATAAGARLNKWCWSGLWLDLENDGWNDLLVNTKHLNPNPIFANEFGNFALKNYQGVFSQNNSTGISGLPYAFFTASKGDFNNDGLYDICLGAETGQQSRVFQNNTVTSNNFVKCRLKGRLSNHNGVGTYIDYYLNGEHRIHYTQLGENYLSQNSQNNIFGIGNSAQIDSLRLSWISGVVDTYYNIPANTTHVFVEGETMPQIQASKAFLCPNGNDSLELSIPGWPTHVWGNGSTAESITVATPGIYTVTVGTGYGHTLQLNYTVEMASADAFEIMRSHVACAGESTGALEVLNLSTNEIVFQQAGLPAGNFTFPLTISEGCVVQEQVFIEEPLPFLLVVDSIVPACFENNNGSAIVHVMGGTAPYTGFNDFGSLALTNLASGTYSDTIADANGCNSSYSFAIAEIPQAIIEVTSSNWVCPGEIVIFEATVSGDLSNYFWDVLSPGATLGAGNYVTAVVDSFQCVTTIDFVVDEIATPTIDAMLSAESVFGLGSISLNVIGNHAPYTATWQSGHLGLNYEELAQGNYNVTVSDSFGCAVDTMFTVLFDFVGEQMSQSEFIIDWKAEQLKYIGNERLFEVKVYNTIGQLLISKASLGQNEILHLNGAPQMIFISSSKGNSRSKVLLR